jgi:hypothetical protein
VQYFTGMLTQNRVQAGWLEAGERLYATWGLKIITDWAFILKVDKLVKFEEPGKALQDVGEKPVWKVFIGVQCLDKEDNDFSVEQLLLKLRLRCTGRKICQEK